MLNTIDMLYDVTILMATGCVQVCSDHKSRILESALRIRPTNGQPRQVGQGLIRRLFDRGPVPQKPGLLCLAS